MSTQQNNAEVADGHSFADKIGQLVSAKYQALFGTTTYSKRRVMSGVVMSRYVFAGTSQQIQIERCKFSKPDCWKDKQSY